MSEDIKNEDVVPASIEAGEPIVAPEVAEKAAEVIAEIVAEAKVEEAPKPAEDVITGPKGSGTGEAQALGSVADGVIGTGKVAKKAAAPKAPVKPLAVEDTVAIYSTRNMHWEGVGKISKGFNIVSKEAAEKWLTKGNIRLADPKEVAKGYGL
jgi:hypothetical protein